jgi:glycosyltransferase involved in cell wall biosynthesis
MIRLSIIIPTFNRKKLIGILLTQLAKQKITDCTISIIVVVDGPLREKLIEDIYMKKLEKNVRFYGEIYDDLLTGELLFISDLMLMPGYLGLSVNHAFCYDCPVFSFKRGENGPYHSPEIDYVVDGMTVYLVDNFNIEKMVSIISDYLNNSEIQKNVKKISEIVSKIIALLRIWLRGLMIA